jgi:hypothetical protein
MKKVSFSISRHVNVLLSIQQLPELQNQNNPDYLA